MYRVFLLKLRHEEKLRQDEDRQSSPASLLPAFLRRKALIVAHHVAVGTVLTPLMASRLAHEPGELMVACALVMEGR